MTEELGGSVLIPLLALAKKHPPFQGGKRLSCTLRAHYFILPWVKGGVISLCEVTEGLGRVGMLIPPLFALAKAPRFSRWGKVLLHLRVILPYSLPCQGRCHFAVRSDGGIGEVRGSYLHFLPWQKHPLFKVGKGSLALYGRIVLFLPCQARCHFAMRSDGGIGRFGVLIPPLFARKKHPFSRWEKVLLHSTGALPYSSLCQGRCRFCREVDGGIGDWDKESKLRRAFSLIGGGGNNFKKALWAAHSRASASHLAYCL